MKKVELKEDCGTMPKGSVFEVEKETKTLYKGIWSSMLGSYNVTVPKKICKQYRQKKIVIDYSSSATKELIRLLNKRL